MGNFSTWLQLELEKKKMNQAELAKLTNSSEATISRLVGGSRKPSSNMCSSIAKALDLSPEEVFITAGLLPKKISFPLLDTIIHKYSLLNNTNQKLVISFLDMLIELQK